MNHGYWCNARTIPLICRYCHEPVYYFSCDCGCKVFFDSLGWPWPKHFCDEYLNSVSAVSAGTCYEPREERALSWTLIGPDEQIDITLDETYVDRVRKNEITLKQKRYTIERVDSTPGAVQYQIGIVRELIEPINKGKRFGVVIETAIGQQLLGRFRTGDLAQLTIHSSDLALDNPLSFTFLVKNDSLRQGSIRAGSHVSVKLSAECVKGKYYWYCEQIESLDD